MNIQEFSEKKINNLLGAIRKDLIEKETAYSQFVGYTKALTEFGIIKADEAKEYRIQLAKVLF